MREKTSITLDPEARRQATVVLRNYFSEYWDEDVDDLKLALLLDAILEEIAPSVYNAAIADARAFFEERAGDLAAVCHREEFPSAGRRRR